MPHFQLTRVSLKTLQFIELEGCADAQYGKKCEFLIKLALPYDSKINCTTKKINLM